LVRLDFGGIWTISTLLRSIRGTPLLITIAAAAIGLSAQAADVQTITAGVAGVRDGNTITNADEDCWLIEGAVASDIKVRN
jgi:hypothetical protein